MVRCSFCDQPLACKACNRPFHAPSAEPHLAVYQPDMHVACPECHQLLVCKLCGYVYGEEGEDTE
jgi:hypothetical protein